MMKSTLWSAICDVNEISLVELEKMTPVTRPLLILCSISQT